MTGVTRRWFGEAIAQVPGEIPRYARNDKGGEAVPEAAGGFAEPLTPRLNAWATDPATEEADDPSIV
jgi:hypothetical protein